MRFITDGMLGKITRWLRILGQDVTYFHSMDDLQLLKIAKLEARTLLTRDLPLFQRAAKEGVNAVLVEAKTESEKLAALANQFGFSLEVDLTVSRCPKCNARIKSVPKNVVIDEIPRKTSSYYNQFWKCFNCGQIYWHGAHWKRIEKTLNAAQKALSHLRRRANAFSHPEEPV